MQKVTQTSAVIDTSDVNGAFVGSSLRPFTKDEFDKIKTILARKKKRGKELTVTDRDLRAAGLERLLAEVPNGKPSPQLQ